MRRRFWVLLSLGLLVFFASAGTILYGLERGSAELVLAAAWGLPVASVLFLLSALLPSRRVDWKRIRDEQRLWESGPLGRSWLQIRQRLKNLWKL